MNFFFNYSEITRLFLSGALNHCNFFSKISDNSVDKQDVTCYINFNNNNHYHFRKGDRC